jgi:hypothetical protein
MTQVCLFRDNFWWMIYVIGFGMGLFGLALGVLISHLLNPRHHHREDGP